MKGVVAAGHPLTAEAGAGVLREGGNAVDAAICAVLASFAVESPLTGLGAGGYMMVHRGGRDHADRLLRRRARPRRHRAGAELAPVPVHFDAETVQTFYVGPASCGVPGTAAGLVRALERFGSMPLEALVGPGVGLAREGAPINAEQAYILDILAPIHDRLAGTRELYRPDGAQLGPGDPFRFPQLAEALERFGAEGAEPFYRGELAAALSDFVVEHGGTLGRGDLASYEAIERRPIMVPFRGAEVLTNPPPSSGGILIAYCLGLLERLGERSGPEQLVAAMGAANGLRDLEFAEALYREGMVGGLPRARPDLKAGDLLGSTTHISVLDATGCCASVTCSNGSGSGDARSGNRGDPQQHAGRGGPQPARLPPDRSRPPGALDDGADDRPPRRRDRARRRQRRLQPDPLGDPADGRACWSPRGWAPATAVDAPRLHFEQGVVQAEPGIDEAALARLEARGLAVARRPAINLFFGGVQAVARDPATGALSGGGDPRRGGAVATA